jgi:ABC-type proline/glycine betaine transport systems, permease component
MYEAIINYLNENTSYVISLVLQHIKISFLAVIIAVIVGVPIGILSSRSQRLYNLFSNFFGLLRVIPSLAILVLCVPIIGVGIFPATIALIVLAIPPILINTATAYKNIPEAILENAVGMGMNSKGIFLRVKLPLAMPLILTGIKTATVEVIASATLAAYIGAGGLGEVIFTGLGLYRMDMLLIGGGSVAILSLTAEIIFSIVEWSISGYERV